MAPKRAQIWFDGPDEAYLVAAAIRRHMRAAVVPDLLLVPTRHGPTIELTVTVLEDPLVKALVRRFGGHVDAADGAMDGRPATARKAAAP
jgi:hypothetical protein